MAKKDGKELTPMMKQFFDFKAKYPEAVLLFRCGDFYETYCEDAVIAAHHVIKPALVGLTGPWISGGIEFNWPQHHRPSTYLPVD